MASSATQLSASVNDTVVIQARGSKLVDVSVRGMNNLDVVLAQRSPDGGTTWDTIETYTSDTERVLQSGSFKDYRLKYSDDTGAGTVDMTIRAGNAY